VSETARILIPELLDALPAEDPRAIGSRRDLVRINFIMRQQAAMVKLLRSVEIAPRRIADLGSGDGRFLLGVARQMAKYWPAVTAIVIDQQNIVGNRTRDGFAALGWHCENRTGDIFEMLPRLEVDIITANLFLHHFDNASLRNLLQLAGQSARAFLACEPRRSQLALLASRMVFALGCNDVTRHDAVASVRAGFAGRELSQLWPGHAGWRLEEAGAFPFSHCFAAQRDAG
jgi:SAM-dependent methyltransferase